MRCDNLFTPLRQGQLQDDEDCSGLYQLACRRASEPFDLQLAQLRQRVRWTERVTRCSPCQQGERRHDSRIDPVDPAIEPEQHSQSRFMKYMGRLCGLVRVDVRSSDYRAPCLYFGWEDFAEVKGGGVLPRSWMRAFTRGSDSPKLISPFRQSMPECR